MPKKLKNIVVTSMICLMGYMATGTCQHLSAVEIVKGGASAADIVISKDALPQVVTAAKVLQENIFKISGAKLEIKNEEDATTANYIYIGPSEFTEKLGIKIDDIKDDGFKIIAKENFLAIIGYDEKRPTAPRGYDKLYKKKQMQKEWEEYTGHKWEFPRILRDPRLYSKDFDFHMYDAAGTLYGVYDFLERLGMRWFMPMEELGVVMPELKDIKVSQLDIKKEPAFASRYYPLAGICNNPREFLWLKYLKTGGMFDMYPAHSSMAITKFQQEKSEFFARKNGKYILCGPERYLPKLSSELLRKELAEYLIKLGDAIPEMPDLPIGQPDGWLGLDDEDVKNGWDKVEEGRYGRFSDYTWDFVINVANRVLKKRPNARFNTMAYAYTKAPPKNIEKIPENIAIYITQTSNLWGINTEELSLREQWLKKAPSNDYYIYDYYLAHANKRALPPVPVIFTKAMDKSFRNAPDNFKGIYVELVGSPKSRNNIRMKLPGLNHLTLYLHGKYTWNKKLDLKQVLDDYYDKFYGPAKNEMRDFFEFSEEVWMRPEPRQITSVSGFIKKDDINKYFTFLDKAKEKAGESIYRKRIEFIEEEMEPLKDLFSNLERTGPYVRIRNMSKIKSRPTIDGDLTEEFWTKYHPKEFLWMKNNLTGNAIEVNPAKVSFRWLSDSSLVIGITCFESKMSEIVAATTADSQDDMLIYQDDNVEVYLDTPQGYQAKIVVNPNGATLDRCVTPDVTDVPEAWKAEAVGVKKYDDRWTVEIMVKGLGELPTKSYPWGVNACRQRLAGNSHTLYAISPTGGRFDIPKKRGNLYDR